MKVKNCCRWMSTWSPCSPAKTISIEVENKRQGYGGIFILHPLPPHSPSICHFFFCFCCSSFYWIAAEIQHRILVFCVCCLNCSMKGIFALTFQLSSFFASISCSSFCCFCLCTVSSVFSVKCGRARRQALHLNSLYTFAIDSRRPPPLPPHRWHLNQ